MLLVLFDRKATSASDCTVPRCVHSRIGRGLQFSTQFSARRAAPGGGGRVRRAPAESATSRFVCLCVKLRFTVQYRRTTRLVRRAQRYGKRMATAHGPRRAQGRQQTHVSCTSSHRASLDLPVKSYCVSSVLSSGAYRVAARLLLPLRRLHAFLAGEEASSCRTPHSTVRRHVRYSRHNSRIEGKTLLRVAFPWPGPLRWLVHVHRCPLLRFSSRVRIPHRLRRSPMKLMGFRRPRLQTRRRWR